MSAPQAKAAVRAVDTSPCVAIQSLEMSNDELGPHEWCYTNVMRVFRQDARSMLLKLLAPRQQRPWKRQRGEHEETALLELAPQGPRPSASEGLGFHGYRV